MINFSRIPLRRPAIILARTSTWPIRIHTIRHRFLRARTMDHDQIPTLRLTADERRLFRLLNAAAATAPLPVTCRVAGGWVRDKLLGKQSDDLDIALDAMMGYDFALVLAAFVRDQPLDAERAVAPDHVDDGHDDPMDHSGHSNAAAVPGAHLHQHHHRTHAPLVVPNGASSPPMSPASPATPIFAGLAKIQSNPDKSKHLETATCRVLGYDLDFVNLRSETYLAHSRIPAAIDFGTPAEDAERRDCTINALFYNIATDTVEDFTGHGLRDLRDGVVRTPLAASETFHDDPLRVLRAVRFASRLAFRLHPTAVAAVRGDPAIHDALANKISKERIGVEVGKMMAAAPAHATALLHDLGVWRTVALAHFKELEFYDAGAATSPNARPELPQGVTVFAVAADASMALVNHADVEARLPLHQSVQATAVLEWLIASRSSTSAHHPVAPPLDPATWIATPGSNLLSTPVTLAALTLPFEAFLCGIPHASSIAVKSTKRPQVQPPVTLRPLAAHVVRFSLKLTNHDADWVAAAHAAAPVVARAAREYRRHHNPSGDEDDANTINTRAARVAAAVLPGGATRGAWTGAALERVALGALVRGVACKTHVADQWRAAVAVALVRELAPLVSVVCESNDSGASIPHVTGPAPGREAEVAELVDGYRNLLDRIHTVGVSDAWAWKAMINGNEAAQALKLPKGPLLREALDWVAEFQLAEPTADGAAARQWLVDHFQAGWKPAAAEAPAMITVSAAIKREHTPDAPRSGDDGTKRRRSLADQ
ncbi:hypothetical protein BC828DRAFT_376455 [Blastocladiella britannica]|nr:hypothetical protein BC828DRAFT_376455 [Blastocladiella britannica]